MVNLKTIQDSLMRIKPHTVYTPLIPSKGLSQILNTNIVLKLENKQKTGSFKLRGALNKILQLSEKDIAKGIITASAGNHAQGVAFGATIVGAESHVIMPFSTPINKVAATQGYGAQVELHGTGFDESYIYARQLEKKNDYTFVHPFEDEQVISGQGTIALEILEQMQSQNLDSIIVPVGGGGLIAGIATVLKALHPKIKVYGAVAQRASGMRELYKAHHVSPPNKKGSIADGINVKKPSQTMFKKYISPLVDDIVAVEEDDIASAMVYLLENEKTVTEGAGAIGLAAAFKAQWDLGQNCCLLLSGGNVDLNLLANIIDRGLSRRGRISRISFVIDDQSGMMALITKIIAEKQANILDIHHDRLNPKLPINETILEIVMETRNHEHIEEIKTALLQVGARFTPDAICRPF